MRLNANKRIQFLYFFSGNVLIACEICRKFAYQKEKEQTFKHFYPNLLALLHHGKAKNTMAANAIFENSANVNNGKPNSGENTTNSARGVNRRIMDGETAYQKAQALINSRRARALKWCTLRTICEEIEKHNGESVRHFGQSAYKFAREHKNTRTLTVYGEVFTFPVDSTNSTTAARWLVAISNFFGKLDISKASEESRKLKQAANEAKALQTIAAAQGVDVETLMQALQALKS